MWLEFRLRATILRAWTTNRYVEPGLKPVTVSEVVSTLDAKTCKESALTSVKLIW